MNPSFSLARLLFIFALVKPIFLYSATHFTLKGSATSSNLGLNSQALRSGSASIAFDIGTYLRAGFTHRQAANDLRGYQLNKLTNEYDYNEENTHTIANSIDLTIILYYGKLFVPYLQIGIVKKDYLIKSKVNAQETVESPYSLAPVPNSGIGVGIRLNRRFSLKLSLSVSPGIKQSRPDLEPQGVLDTYSALGITYNI